MSLCGGREGKCKYILLCKCGPEDNSFLGAGSSLPSLQGLQELNTGCWVSSPVLCTGCLAASQIISFNLLIFFLFLFLFFFNHICWRTQVVYPLLIAGLYWQSPVALCWHTRLSPVSSVGQELNQEASSDLDLRFWAKYFRGSGRWHEVSSGSTPLASAAVFSHG